MTFALPFLVFVDKLGSRVEMEARLLRDISLDREETTAVWGIKHKLGKRSKRKATEKAHNSHRSTETLPFGLNGECPEPPGRVYHVAPHTRKGVGLPCRTVS